MSLETKMLPAIFPKTSIVSCAARGRQMTVRSLCREAGIECRVTGPPASREIHLLPASELGVAREPGPSGTVSIRIPSGNRKEQAILALGILAYSVFDYAARECMRGLPESRLSLPLGRPLKAHPLSGAERQRNWRKRHLSGFPRGNLSF
jgi:hypothetical protein